MTDVMATRTNTARVEQWGMFELMLEGSSAGNPYMEVELTARFSQGDRLVEVFGFYDGDGIYRVRFMPDTLGEWHYETRCNNSAVTRASGTFTCSLLEKGIMAQFGLRMKFTLLMQMESATSQWEQPAMSGTCRAMRWKNKR